MDTEAHFVVDRDHYHERPTYHGYLVDISMTPRVIWQCDHKHRSAEEALHCAGEYSDDAGSG